MFSEFLVDGIYQNSGCFWEFLFPKSVSPDLSGVASRLGVLVSSVMTGNFFSTEVSLLKDLRLILSFWTQLSAGVQCDHGPMS